jgi:ubiquilin
MTDITINIKCSNSDKSSVVVSTSATIVELKAKIAEVTEVPPESQRLIYKGKVLKDDSTVEFYAIADGDTCHMVRGQGNGGGSGGDRVLQ